MALRRKIKLNEAFFQGEVWIPAAELVKKYRCPRLLTLTEKNYSKLGSIGSPGGVVTKALCRALLTDRGMLFAQTREKGYPHLKAANKRAEASVWQAGYLARENEMLRQMILLATAAERSKLNSGISEVVLRLIAK